MTTSRTCYTCDAAVPVAGLDKGVVKDGITLCLVCDRMYRDSKRPAWVRPWRMGGMR